MHLLYKDKLFLVLAALLSLTLLSWFLVRFINIDLKNMGVLLIFLAFFKVRLVTVHFMEIKKADRPVMIAFELWVLVVWGITTVLYLL